MPLMGGYRGMSRYWNEYSTYFFSSQYNNHIIHVVSTEDSIAHIHHVFVFKLTRRNLTQNFEINPPSKKNVLVENNTAYTYWCIGEYLVKHKKFKARL